MKAPDKLYIEIDNKAHVYFGLQPENAVEYIRKDALIEILQGYSHPLTKLVMQEIIEKINSL